MVVRGRHLLVLVLAVAGSLSQGCGCSGSGGGGGGAPMGNPTPPGPGGGGTLPAGLPAHFGLGVSQGLGQVSWMQTTNTAGAHWDYRYQYLSGNINAGLGNNANWSGWNPVGEFPRLYAVESHANNWIPVFSYYCIAQSGGEANLGTLTNSGTMYNYFAAWKLLMQKCNEAGGTIIVHHEPDFWGFVQSQKGDNPANTPANVASSGFPDAAGLPNNAAGFAQALVKIRDTYGSNVILGWHASNWATNFDIAFNGDGATLGGRVATFFNGLGANFELIFNDFSDRDTGYYESINQPRPWTDSTFARSRAYLGAISSGTGRKIMIWFIPCGNTLYRTCNNTNGHFQSPFAEYFLKTGNRPRIVDWVAGGVIGLLFGPALAETTSFTDSKGDGTTNPGAINGNTLTSSYADDDGGFLRLGAIEYYTNSVAIP